MMKFDVKKGNYLKSDNSEYRIHIHIITSLMILLLFGIYKNGVYLFFIKSISSIELGRVFLYVFLPIICAFITNHIMNKFMKLKEESYSFMIYVLIFINMMPINIPIIYMIFGSIIITIFKSLGKYYIHYSALLKVLCLLMPGLMFSNSIYLNGYENGIYGSTPLANIFSQSNLFHEYGFFNTLLGNVPGAFGTTSNILLILIFIYLFSVKVIKWRSTLSYMVTVFISFLIIGFGYGNVHYAIFNIMVGSLLFEAIYIVSDNETSPISKEGMCLYGILSGIALIICRFIFKLGEASVLGLVFVNLFVPIIERLSIILRRNKKILYICYTFLFFLVTIISIYIK